MTENEMAFRLNAVTSIPAVGFGTYLISNDDAPAAVSAAIANGYRHIDTAAGYQNETAVGEGIQQGLEIAGITRKEIFVTTKFWPGNAEWGDEPKSKDQTITDSQSSLDQLGLEYTDLHLIHAPYGGDQRLEQWRAFLALRESGKARSIGVSNFNVVHLNEIKAAGLPMPDANQIELHPWSQKQDLIAYMSEHNIAPIAYSSLVPLSTWRVEPGQDSAKTDEMKADSSVFQEMAAKYEVTEAQLLLRWGIQNGYAVLPKSLRPERMRQNIDLFSFFIDDADMAQISTMDRGEGVAWASGDPSK